MPQIAGTTDTHRVGSAGGNREDLEDVFWDLFADDNYMLNTLDKVDGQATYHEWMADSLVAPTTNRQIEGDDAAFVTVANASRLGNYHQISRKTFLISRTQERVNKVGPSTTSARQIMKQMRELRNEMEYALVRNQASSAGGSATGRSSGGLESWIAGTAVGGNAVLATTTASATTPGFTSGAVAAPTDGTTTAALTIGSLTAALQLAWEDGGNDRTLLVGTTQKNAIDQFTGIAQRQIDVRPGSSAQIVNAASVLVTSYGVHTVYLHRHVRSSVVLGVDPDYLAISFIDRPFMEKLAKTGDGDKYQMLSEFALVVRNPNAHCKVVACA